MATTLAGTPAKAETPAEVEGSAAETLATANLTTTPEHQSSVKATLPNVVLFQNKNNSDSNICKASCAFSGEDEL
jgi:hypothetical protein